MGQERTFPFQLSTDDLRSALTEIIQLDKVSPVILDYLSLIDNTADLYKLRSTIVQHSTDEPEYVAQHITI